MSSNPVILNWGAVAVGGVAGIGAALIIAVPVLAFAGTDGFWPQALLILAGFLGQVVAGYAAGRFAGYHRPAHGGLAALLSYLVTAAVSIATGNEPAIAILLFSGVVALILGSAGGVLADLRSRSS